MKISIVVPCYNAEKYLPAMIESVLEQSYSTLELIIVNDGSTDASLNIMEKYASNDARIKVIDEKNSGKPSIVRNKGIKAATGDLLTFLDADDIYSLDRLKLIVESFNQQPNCSICIHDFNRVSENGKVFSSGLIKEKWQSNKMADLFEKKSNYYLSKKDLYLSFLDNWFYICSDSIAIKTKDFTLTELLFDESLVYFEDLNKWSELVVNRQVIFLNKVLASYRETPGSLMSQALDFDIAAIAFFQRHLTSPLIELPERTKLNIQRRLIGEIKDSLYGVANKGLISNTFKFSFMLLKISPSLIHFKTAFKNIVTSIIKSLF